MSEDWESKTVIGRGTRGGGGNRDTVIRNSSQLNAARRSGTSSIETTRKYAIGNQAKGASGGQRMTMVDRSDDVVKKAQMPKEIKKWLPLIRNQTLDKDGKPMTQEELARQCRTTPAMIAHIEGGKTDIPDGDLETFNKVINAAEKTLKHTLRGVNAGDPKMNAREKKELEERKAAEKKKAKEEAKRLKEEEEAKAKEAEEAAAKEAEETAAREKAEEEQRSKEEEQRSKQEAATKAMAKAKLDDDDDEDDEE